MILRIRGRGALGACLAAVLIVAGSGAAPAGAPSAYRLLVLDGSIVKWGPPVLGTGATVTYAVADAAAEFADARNCRSIVPPDGLLAASKIPAATFQAELAAAFAAWSAVADITFRPSDPATADVLIAAQRDPFGVAFTNVSHGPPVAGVPAAITRSVICLNPSAAWKVGFNGDLNSYDLRYALEHEIGHAIGLDHPGVPGVLMDFRYTEAFRVPQSADIAGAALLYGGHGAGAPGVAAAAEVAEAAAREPVKPDPFLGSRAP